MVDIDLVPIVVNAIDVATQDHSAADYRRDRRR